MRLQQPLSFLMSLIFTASASSESYIVQKGDTLSLIAKKNFGAPIYGPKASLEKLLQINPTVTNKDQIFPGQVLILKIEEAKREVAEDEAVQVPQNFSEEKIEDFNRRSQIYFSPTTFFSRMDGVDPLTNTSGQLISSLNYGFDIGWMQLWTANFKTHIGLETKKIKFNTSKTRVITGAEQTLAGIYLGVVYKNLDFKIGSKENIFYEATSVSTIRVDKAPVTFASLEYLPTLIILDPFVAGVQLRSSYLSATKTEDYDIKSGSELGGGLWLQQNFSGQYLRVLKGSLFIDQVRQDTSLLELKQQHLGLKLHLEWEL